MEGIPRAPHQNSTASGCDGDIESGPEVVRVQSFGAHSHAVVILVTQGGCGHSLAWGPF